VSAHPLLLLPAVFLDWWDIFVFGIDVRNGAATHYHFFYPDKKNYDGVIKSPISCALYIELCIYQSEIVATF